MTKPIHDKADKNKMLPIAKNEDVEFSFEQADADDMEAMKKAQEADDEQQDYYGC